MVADWAGLPSGVLGAVACGGRIVGLHEEILVGGTGPANKGVVLLQFLVDADGERRRIDVVRKTLKPVETGRHAILAHDPRHWAFWRREADAYASGLLPAGPGLRAPTCMGVHGDDLYLEHVDGSQPAISDAGGALAGWQAGYRADLDRPWLARGQLAQRLAVSDLDWSGVGADPRAVELWERRDDYLALLAGLPLVRSHGDFSLGNLRQADADLVVLDWASFGWEPVGFDLAHLALSSGEDPRPSYLASGPRWSEEEVDTGFGACAAIIGSSRVHWMLTRGVEVPSWYVDFLWAHRPR